MPNADRPSQRSGAKLRVRVISESTFTVAGHGVHSAFAEHAKYLATRQDVEFSVNGRPGRGVDLVHTHTVGPYALLFLLVARGARVASAHVIPDSLVGSVVGAERLGRLARLYLSWFYNRADLVVAVSEHVKTELTDLGVKTRIDVIPNFIACQDVRRSSSRRAQIRSELGVGPSDVLVASVGQVQPRKGVLEFLAVARQLPEVKFLWVGDSIFGAASLERVQLRQALMLASPNVIFAGRVPRNSVYDFLAAADVYVSLARQETFGIAVLEAAAAGRPLVLSDLPVFRTIYREAAQYAPHDEMAKILSALAASSAMRHEWGNKAARMARQYHSELNGEALLSSYRSLLASRRIGDRA